MATFSISINKQILQEISNEIGDRTAEELKNIGDNQSLLLKKIALDYLQVVEKNKEKIKIIEETEKRLKEKRHSLNLSKNPKDPKLVQQYNEYKEQLRNSIQIDTTLNDFFKASLLFNEAIVEILTGRKTRITIVIPVADQAPIIRDYSIEELLDQSSGVSIIQDITSGNIPRVAGRLQYNIEKMKNDFNVAIQKDTMIDLNELNALNETYNSALFDNFNKYKPYVFWKPLSSDIWYKMKISGGAGDISEGYAYFYYKSNETNFEFATHHLYDNLDTFFRIGVASVSNLSGLYAGDISTAQYEYAVKSLQASLPGYVQMVRMAQKIINNKIKNVENLKKIALKAQYKNPIQKTGEKGLRNVVSVALEEDLLNKINTDIQMQI